MNDENDTSQDDNSIDYIPIPVENATSVKLPPIAQHQQNNSKTSANFQVRLVQWHLHTSELKKIRGEVFIHEQNVPADLEWDVEDSSEDMRHFLLYGLSESGFTDPQATARLQIMHNGDFVTGRLGRMAVLKEFRQQGLGKALLQKIIECAVSEGVNEIFAHAQVSALKFYEINGFAADKEEEPFTEAGIPHITVRCNVNDSQWLHDVFQDKIVRLSSIQGFTLHATHCTRVARTQVDIFSTRLSPQLYSDPELVEAISHLARAHARAKVRILIQDSRDLSGRTHALLALAQRLPSVIEVKRLSQGIDHVAHGFLMGDQKHLLYFNDEEEWNGFVNYQAAAESQQLSENFNYYWESHSEPDPNLKRLSL